MAAAMDPKPDKLQDNIILKFRNLKVTVREKILVISVLLVFSTKIKCIFRTIEGRKVACFGMALVQKGNLSTD